MLMLVGIQIIICGYCLTRLKLVERVLFVFSFGLFGGYFIMGHMYLGLALGGALFAVLTTWQMFCKRRIVSPG